MPKQRRAMSMTEALKQASKPTYRPLNWVGALGFRPVNRQPLGLNRDCPIEKIFTKISTTIKPNSYKIYTKGCFPMYNRPWDVSRIVNRTFDINFALQKSGIGHAHIKKLKFPQCLQIPTTLLEESALIYYQIRTASTPI